MIERTLAIIKPDAMPHKEAILKRIHEAGFFVLQQCTVQLTPEQASEFYKQKCNAPNYSLLIMALSAGPIHAMCIAKENAIAAWKKLTGPDLYRDAKRWPGCLRDLYAYPYDDLKNAVHGSEHYSAVQEEIHFFFPNIILEPVSNEEQQNRYLQSTVNPILMDGLFKLAQQRPENPVIWLANWLQSHNPYQPTIYVSSDEVVEQINLVDSCQVQNNVFLKPSKCLKIRRKCKKCDFTDDDSTLLSCGSLASAASSVTKSADVFFED